MEIAKEMWKGSEVVNGEDEILIVGVAHLTGAGEGAEVVEDGFRVAEGEGLADKGAQIIAVADRRGDVEEVLLV